MLNSRMEQIASAAGHLFFFAAIILFIMLILGLEPALIENLTVPVGPGEEERWARCPYHDVWYDPWTSHCHICWTIPLPEIPPRPSVAIAPPPWFCYPCWEWHIHGCLIGTSTFIPALLQARETGVRSRPRKPNEDLWWPLAAENRLAEGEN